MIWVGHLVIEHEGICSTWGFARKPETIESCFTLRIQEGALDGVSVYYIYSLDINLSINRLRLLLLLM